MARKYTVISGNKYYMDELEWKMDKLDGTRKSLKKLLKECTDSCSDKMWWEIVDEDRATIYFYDVLEIPTQDIIETFELDSNVFVSKFECNPDSDSMFVDLIVVEFFCE